MSDDYFNAMHERQAPLSLSLGPRVLSSPSCAAAVSTTAAVSTSLESSTSVIDPYSPCGNVDKGH